MRNGQLDKTIKQTSKSTE